MVGPNYIACVCDFLNLQVLEPVKKFILRNTDSTVCFFFLFLLQIILIFLFEKLFSFFIIIKWWFLYYVSPFITNNLDWFLSTFENYISRSLQIMGCSKFGFFFLFFPRLLQIISIDFFFNFKKFHATWSTPTDQC